MYEIAWFSTARGPTSRLLLKEAHDAVQRGDLNVRFSFVFCNRERGEAEDTDRFLDQVESYGIPLLTLSSTRLRNMRGEKGPGYDGKTFAPWREAYDQEVLRRLEGFHPQLVVLAGYMLVMTPPLCQRFPAVNLHPAPPGGPIGAWQQVIWKLIEDRAPVAGAYMHLVTPDLDLGPIVTYYTFPIQGPEFEPLWKEAAEPLFQHIREEGVRREVPLILETIRAFSEGNVSLRDGALVDKDNKAISGYDLTPAIEARLRRKAATEGTSQHG